MIPKAIFYLPKADYRVQGGFHKLGIPFWGTERASISGHSLVLPFYEIHK